MPASSPAARFDPRTLLLRPRGRIGRVQFIVGAAMFVALALASVAVMRLLDPSTAAGFWWGFAMFLLFLPFALYSVAGQRLHDMGRSVWPLTWLLIIMVAVMFSVAYSNGGEEYIDTLAGFDRRASIDPAIKQAADDAYRARLAEGGANRTLSLLLSGLLGAFVLALALVPGQRGENRWGEVPGGVQ